MTPPTPRAPVPSPMEAKHTPLPWLVSGPTPGAAKRWFIDSANRAEGTIAEIRETTSHARGISGHQANADLIVAALNAYPSHQLLIEALDLFSEAVSTSPQMGGQNPVIGVNHKRLQKAVDRMFEIRAALASAGKTGRTG